MPAFTFEKISPPAPRTPVAASAIPKTQRSVIVTLLDRLTEAKLQRTERNVQQPPNYSPK
jgi:hypothetical protein